MRMLTASIESAARAAVVGALVVALNATAGAQVAGTDETAGYIVFPKIVVDTTGILGSQTDTLVQITNTDLTNARSINCNWIDATSRCGGCPPPNTPPAPPGAQFAACDVTSDCNTGLACVPCWSETDFSLLLTAGQPIAFYASAGETLPCLGTNDPDPGCLEANEGIVTAVPSNPFRGELKCYQTIGYLDDELANRNDLKGEATIISGDGTSLQSAAYNAYGFQTAATAPGTSPGGPLCLGGPLANPCDGGSCGLQYAGCPGVLILNHFFEFAPNPLGELEEPASSFVRTNLTLVPCTERINLGDGADNQVTTTAQMLIYNEFEQRFSSSTRVQCYKDIPLSDIDTRSGPTDDAFSIFAVGVQGTMTGQTRIRGVASEEDTVGHGLIGVAHESYFTRAASTAPAVLVDTAAFDLHQQGEREQGDAVCRQ